LIFRNKSGGWEKCINKQIISKLLCISA